MPIQENPYARHCSIGSKNNLYPELLRHDEIRNPAPLSKYIKEDLHFFISTSTMMISEQSNTDMEEMTFWPEINTNMKNV
jgi:hypothetical protein